MIFLRQKSANLKSSGNIQITTGAEIETVNLQPSGYKITLKGGGTSLEVRAAVLATGFDPFDPSPIEEYGYGRLKDVITAFELEAQLTGRKGGKTIHRVATTERIVPPVCGITGPENQSLLFLLLLHLCTKGGIGGKEA